MMKNDVKVRKNNQTLWFFRCKKSGDLCQTSLPALSLVKGVDYVPMLIPNPVGGEVNEQNIQK